MVLVIRSSSNICIMGYLTGLDFLVYFTLRMLESPSTESLQVASPPKIGL